MGSVYSFYDILRARSCWKKHVSWPLVPITQGEREQAVISPKLGVTELHRVSLGQVW